MGVRRETFTVGDVEPQVIPLVWGRLLVVVDEDDKADGVPDRHGDVGVGRDGHLEAPASHDSTPAAGQDEPFPIIQDDPPGCDLQVRPLWLIAEDGDGAEVSPMLLVAVGWCGSSN